MQAPENTTPAGLAAWLASPESSDALRAAEASIDASGGDPVAASTGLRRALSTLHPDRASAALEQVELRLLARQRYGIDARRLLVTRDGLEQATRPEVAAYRAAQIAAAGASRVVDLTGGLGFDAAALAAAGLDVTAVELDETTALFLAHNCPSVRIVHADATDPVVLHELIGELGPADVMFADPARRDPRGPRDASLRARPERDPSRWSPPWPWIQALPHPRVAAKVAPSFRAPAGWRSEWVSVRRTVVECSIYSWPIFAAPRRATMWTDDGPVVIDADAKMPPVGNEAQPGWLHEPDPAILKAGVLSTVVHAKPSLWALDEESTWLASDIDIDLSFLRSFAVIEELVGSATSQRRQLDRLGVRGLTVKSRDAGVAPHTVLRELDRREGNDHVLVVTRRAGRTVRFVCRPAPSRSA